MMNDRMRAAILRQRARLMSEPARKLLDVMRGPDSRRYVAAIVADLDDGEELETFAGYLDELYVGGFVTATEGETVPHVYGGPL